MKPSTFLLFLIVFITGCSSTTPTSDIPFFTDDNLTPVWIQGIGKNEGDMRKIESCSFLDQKGAEVSNSSMEGHIYVASFFFTDCKDICPTLRTRLTTIQDAFDPKDVMILSHSVMPENDTIERLEAYSQINGIDASQWHLLTGNKAEIYSLATSSYGANLTRQTGSTVTESDFLHTETFYLVDGAGYLRGLYNGTLPLEVERLLEDARTLISEAD